MAETFDVIVIGSGPGGYVAAIRCAQLGLKTACVEKDPGLGGTCLNVGCIPSKALLYSSELYEKALIQGKEQGLLFEKAAVDFDQMMKRKKNIVAGFNEGVAALFKKNQIARFLGVGTVTSATSVEVKGEKPALLQAKSLILATGSEPMGLPFLPFDEKRIISSTGALSLEQIPKKMVVIGAGIIGVELGSVYRRLGCQVTFIEFLDKICPTLDESISKAFQEILEKQGLKFHLSSKVVAAKIQESPIELTFEKGGKAHQISADSVLLSIGRRPYTDQLGLDRLQIQRTEKGFIKIDGRFRTSIPNIYAIGDIVDGPMLAHKASEEGVAVAEIIAGQNPLINYLAIPNVVYTDPEVASVGLTQSEAEKMGLSIKTGQFPFKINSRAKCTGETEGVVKIIAEASTDRIIGMHLIGAHASELIMEGVLAIEHQMTALELGNTVHAHPTFSEAIKEAALAVHKRPIHR